MAAPARKPRPIPRSARRRGGAALREALSVFAVAGLIAYVVLGGGPNAPGPSAASASPMALLPEHLKPVDHHFQNCGQARAAGMTNIPMWHPSYRAAMDRDGDGLACEPYYGR